MLFRFCSICLVFWLDHFNLDVMCLLDVTPECLLYFLSNLNLIRDWWAWPEWNNFLIECNISVSFALIAIDTIAKISKISPTVGVVYLFQWTPQIISHSCATNMVAFPLWTNLLVPQCTPYLLLDQIDGSSVQLALWRRRTNFCLLSLPVSAWNWAAGLQANTAPQVEAIVAASATTTTEARFLELCAQRGSELSLPVSHWCPRLSVLQCQRIDIYRPWWDFCELESNCGHRRALVLLFTFGDAPVLSVYWFLCAAWVLAHSCEQFLMFVRWSWQ